jgi:hypothetical protein
MAGLVCPHCHETIEVFPPVAEERSVWADGLYVLGRVPMDPRLASEPAGPHPAFDPIVGVLLDALPRRDAA